jgi:hypothetical protein
LTPNAIQVRAGLGVLDADGAARCCQPAGRADDADAGVPVAVGNFVANDPDSQGILVVAALFGCKDRVGDARERACGVLVVELALGYRGDRLSSPKQISHPAQGLAVMQ